MNFRETIARWSVRLSQIALAAVFIFAGAVKAADPDAFAEEIMRYQLVPWPVAVVLALWLPFLEIAVGAGMLIPAFRDGALTVATALLVTFTGALLSAWLRGLNIDCGCFGPALGHENVIQGLWRDGLLLIMLAWVWAYRVTTRRRPLSTSTPADASSTRPRRMSSSS